MSIYSANRMGSLSIATCEANTSYGMNDAGTILCECNENDMAIFEGILRCDFNEIAGLNEGSILENEIRALNEKSAKQIFISIKKSLLKFWEKIKGLFKDAMYRISTYTATNGKSFVKRFKKIYEKEKWNGSIENCIRHELDFSGGSYMISGFASNVSKIANDSMDMYNKDMTDFVDEILKDTAPDGFNYTDRKSYVKDMLAFAKREYTLTKKDIPELLNVLDTGKEQINKLNEAKKKAERAVNEFIKIINKAMNKDNMDNSVQLSRRASDLMAAVTYATKAAVAVVKADMKDCRISLQKVANQIAKAQVPKKNSGDVEVQHNFALIEAAESFDAFMNGTNAYDDSDDEDYFGHY